MKGCECEEVYVQISGGEELGVVKLEFYVLKLSSKLRRTNLVVALHSALEGAIADADVEANLEYETRVSCEQTEIVK